MFIKIFAFLLLGSTLILASPVQDNGKNNFKLDNYQLRGVFNTIQSWLKKADDTFVAVYDRVTGPLKKILHVVVETGEGVMDYTKEKVEQLTYKYYEIRRKSQENLNAVKNNFIVRVIGELQHVIDVLSKKTDAETLEKLRQKTEQLAESSKEALETLQQHLQEAIQAEKQKLEQNLKQWKQEADSAINKRRSV